MRGGRREPGAERPTVTREGALEVDRLPESGEPGELLGLEVSVAEQRPAEPAEQCDEREHVVPVVGKDARQRRRAARAEELEVEPRDHGAGHVILAEKAEHLALERGQPAVGEARAPHAA